MSKKFSVVMATLNSERTLEPALKALRAQVYPQELVEILVVDGGSKDHTRSIAARYNCQVVDNPKVDPVSAKLIGMKVAQGDYLMHVDSDEVLVSREALLKRARVFAENPDVKMVFSSGYQNPPASPFAACYINEFGDPFSMFYYRLSKDYRFFLRKMRGLVPIWREEADYLVFELKGGPQLILENASAGNCIDLGFFRAQFPELCDKPWGPVHFFYHMQRFTQRFAVTKEDPILHYSADHWSRFLLKIKWRVHNNVYFVDQGGLGAAGFLGRSQMDRTSPKIRKYLYIPYTFLIFPMALDALVLMWTRRDVRYWLHIPLTLYTAATIVGSLVLKSFGYMPTKGSYGGATGKATGKLDQ